MKIKLYDVVALLEDIPEKNLSRGQVGTLVEKLDDNIFEIEFSDDAGKTYALVPVEAKNFLVLHYSNIKIA